MPLYVPQYRMIKSLPKDIQAQLRSGVAIFSLQQCVEELILNCIDAGSTCVAVKIDIDACKLQVVDNGMGMIHEDMEKVGLRYNTSKCSSVEDLYNLKFYGFRGEAISSIASLAEMVEISSRTKQTVKTFVKRFNDAKASDVFEAENVRPSSGTTVLVYNLFHNMPVRRRRLDPVLESERIRQRVEAISLMHPSVSFTVKKDNSAQMMVQLSKTSSTYYRFVQIHGLSRAQKLREVSHIHEQFQMSGYIGREGHYNNSLQFLFVNERLLLKTQLHKTLNSLLKRCCARQNSPSSYPGTSSPKQRGGSDLQAVYVINIKCHYSEYDVCLEPAKSLIEFKNWDNVLVCIEEGVKACLAKENPMMDSPVETSSSARNPKSMVDVGLVSETCDALIEEKDNASVTDISGGVQTLDEATIHKKTGGDQESEMEIGDVQLKTTLSTEVNNNFNIDGNSNKSSPKVSGMGSKLLKISILNGNTTQDSLLEFCSPNKVSSNQKRIPFNDTKEDKHGFYGEPSKTFKAAPRRKLSLSFETGSLDKFKRLFEEHGKQPSSNKTSLLTPDSLEKSTFCLEDFNEPVFQNASLSPCKKGEKKSLAAKCSFLKRDKEVREESDLLSKEHSSFPNSQDSPFKVKPSELNESLIEEDDSGLSAMVGSVDFPLIAQDKTIPSVSKDSHLYNNKSTSFGGSASCVEAGVTPQHDPEHISTGSEGQTANECVETIPMSSDWLPHYDSCLGRLVYINQETGLSKYNSPQMKEIQVPCIKDVTNMAISVVSKTGFEYRCYPFQTDSVLPFLPKPQAERAFNSGTDSREETQGSGSLLALFSEWQNPVFVLPPEVAVDVTSGQAEGLAVKIHNILFPYRFTKDMMHSMRVINQVDKKFLACLINTAEHDVSESCTNKENLLVLVDQHAAHERVRLEGLIADSYEDDPERPKKRRLCSSSVTPPLEISVTEEELRLLGSCQDSLRGLALGVKFTKSESLSVRLDCLPTCFIEKENTELRRGRRSVIKSIAEEYLRENIELLRSTGRVSGTLPLSVHDVLASQACHGAIKFNDVLSKEECCSLVKLLSSCQLPFQCAHGRPSIIPLADLLHLEDQQELPRPNMMKLRRMYKSWQLYGNDQSQEIYRMNRIRIHVLPSSRGRVNQVARAQEPQSCSFTQRPCSQPRLEGLEFCIKHVLEDKNAPYKQCSYVSNKNGKRCPNAAPKAERKEGVSFCAEHARRNALIQQAQMRKASALGPSPEVLLSQLSGYSRPDSGAHNQEGEASHMQDDDSWSEEEEDPIVLDQTWRGDPDSEAESLDSDHEDPLKHAGVYTAEEVALITREKLIRLQSLYIDQFKRLQHLLKEKKRRYLHSRKIEHETIGSSLLTGPEGLSMKERENLKKLKALRRYRRRYGVEALLHRQLRERRQAVTEAGATQTQGQAMRLGQRCISFVEGTRCSNLCLPMTRHCVSPLNRDLQLPVAVDIHQDSSQVLFKLCPGLKDVPCDRPVHMGQSEEPRCPLHLSLPPPMYQPEQEPLAPEQLASAPTDLYLSAAELQPTENLPLEFSDDLDVEDEGLQCPPSPLLFDTALALEDQTIREIAEAPMDILSETEQGDLDTSAQDAEVDEVSVEDPVNHEKLEAVPLQISSKDSDMKTTDALS
ncbi:hypothetical protein DNTS_030284 [Danionella cerebrum]|uniref:Non-specific lethal 2 homolog n=1 Tax=Danionella cerebrum TaxID=2873325 RepID=A0A553RJV6_9TELE|nr:hypothetical protein DNTS_030284 [Danionella translucida]TRZ02458.1 hypothetical protein DNTS_030284 [Danionella translucida]